MSLPTPPSVAPPPGGASAGDLGMRHRLALADVALILAGAVPLTPEAPATANDRVDFSPCPAGMRRVVVRGFAYTLGAAALTIWHVTRSDGTAYMLTGHALDVGGTFDGADLLPVVLDPGDFLSAIDIAAAGNPVTASIGYVDIEAR